MTVLSSAWLAFVLIWCAFAWLANRRLVLIALPVAAILSAGALWLPTGSPRFTRPPPGKYTVLGIKIEVDQAIYILLDNGSGAPVYYRLPYSAGEANDLTDAMNATVGNEQGGGVTANFGEEGGDSYDGPPPVTAPEVKTPETPEFAQ